MCKFFINWLITLSIMLSSSSLLAAGFLNSPGGPLAPPNSVSTNAAVANAAAMAVAAQVAAPPVQVQVPTPQNFDYSANIASDVFGANLFSGAFSRDGATQFNPDYIVTIGDRIQVRLWGAFDFDAPLTVDPRGNIFIPHAGPVRVMGARNQDLQRIVEAAVGRVFRSNVSSYASLAAAQPVRIYVGGFVNRPGLYNGTSMDSLLHYIDQAGGIDPERGSFLNVQVKRGVSVRTQINLYDFLLKGTIPTIQLSDGDVIFVSSRENTVKVTGMVANAKRFEFFGNRRTVADLASFAKPFSGVTHVRVTRNTGALRSVEYFSIAQASAVDLQNGDELEFTADKKPGTITVRVEGEHDSAQEYVLPYGTRMGALLEQIRYTNRSDTDSLQLIRLSVKERQKQMLQTSLRSLESAALTARSGTSDEARLRKEEADLLLQWIDRAKKVEPTGQVVISGETNRTDLLLENGDIVRVPKRDGLVLISGEVLFPNALAFGENRSLDDYIRAAGGYTQNADSSRVVVAHRDGSYSDWGSRGGLFTTSGDPIRAGDEILVLPKIDVKSRQIWKDLTQILYYIAVSAKVVLDL